MGLLWRLFAPKPLKKARRTVRKATHPVHTAVRFDVRAVLIAEHDNPHDTDAVAVWVQRLKVGHLSRANARRYRPGLLHLQERYGQPIALYGVIAGGGMREDGPGRLGVFLRHNPADFGL